MTNDNQSVAPVAAGTEPQFEDNYSEAAAFAGITFSQGCQFHLYMQYLLGKGPKPGFLNAINSGVAAGTGTEQDLADAVRLLMLAHEYTSSELWTPTNAVSLYQEIKQFLDRVAPSPPNPTPSVQQEGEITR